MNSKELWELTFLDDTEKFSRGMPQTEESMGIALERGIRFMNRGYENGETALVLPERADSTVYDTETDGTLEHYRQDDLNKLCRLLSRRDLVAIYGIAGSGKTETLLRGDALVYTAMKDKREQYPSLIRQQPTERLDLSLFT